GPPADGRRAPRAAGAARPHGARGGEAGGAGPATSATGRGRGRQGLQQPDRAPVPEGAADRGRHPDQGRRCAGPKLRPGGLPRAQRRGAPDQPAQAVAARRDPVREAGRQLSGHADHRRHPALARRERRLAL
ncbi:MAG: Mobile element protein, partial [uncultured Thermomicrobiales bacterium]